MAEYKSKILIIGSGPAGYTAGIYAARAGLSATIVSGPQPGGQLTITTDVENFPGFPTPVAGTQLMEDMRQQALKLGVEIVEDRITEVDFKRRPFECNSENHNLFVGDTVIIATGASARWLGLPSEEKFRGFGVSGCATCDGFFYRGRDVAVVGGGNVAMDAARSALRMGAEHVYIVYRRSEAEMPARKEEVHHAKEEGVEFLNLNNPVEILGDEKTGRVNGMKCIKMELGEPDESGRRRPVAIPGSEYVLDVDTVIMSIGTSPNPLIRTTTAGLEANKRGCLIVNEDTMQTTKDGVYAGGDAVTGAATVILAMGAGKKAAASIDEYIKAKA